MAAAAHKAAVQRGAGKMTLRDIKTNRLIVGDLTPPHKDKKVGVHGSGANNLLNTGDVDDTPVNGATTAPVSSNWAFDHVAATDPHAVYVLESLFDANTIIAADSDNTPTARTVAEQTLIGRITGGNIVALTLTQLATLFHGAGLHHSKACTYISGTGTAGADGTAQAVKTVTLPANSLTQVGDRLRIRMYWAGDTGAPITGTTTLNTVTVANTTDSGTTSLQLTETWLHYIDNTHANIIEQEVGVLGMLSAVNVAGFDWDSDQDIVLSQDMVALNHIIVYALIVDVMPKGVI
mgnify:CR=1 FL=1